MNTTEKERALRKWIAGYRRGTILSPEEERQLWEDTSIQEMVIDDPDLQDGEDYVHKAPRGLAVGGYTRKRRTYGSFVDAGELGVNYPGLQQLTLRGIDYAVEEKTIVVPATGTWAGCEMDPTTVDCLFAPELGTNDDQRLGRVSYPKSIHVTGCVRRLGEDYLIDSGHKQPACVFIALVRDNQTNEVQLNSEDVYTAAPSAASSNSAHPLRNLFFEERFDILATKTFAFHEVFNVRINASNSTHAQGEVFNFDFYVRLSDEVRFSGNGDDISDVTDISYHMVAAADNAEWNYRMSYMSRVRYTC